MDSKLLLGDCEDRMKELADNCIDQIITDPNYGILFMNKQWDVDVPGIPIWKECYRVLKPAGFAFIMSSSRQDVYSENIHRLKMAGFDIAFDSLEWVYACCSSDTEVLTKEYGWMSGDQLHKTNQFKLNQCHILIYDKNHDRFKWSLPVQWNAYQIQDSLIRIKSDKTDQLITRNHRCIVERKGKLIYRTAETISKRIRVPYLVEMPRMSDNFSHISHLDSKTTKKKSKRSISLFKNMQRQSQSQTAKRIQSPSSRSLDRGTEREATSINDERKELGMEGGSDVLQNTWKLQKHQIRALSSSVQRNGKERWICNGTSINSRTITQSMFETNRDCSSSRSQSNQQQSNQSHSICIQSRSQIIRKQTTYKTTLATTTREYYKGIVYCPTTETGCFLARRNGKIFITGNSGFPKAQNFAKAIDKHLLMQWWGQKPFWIGCLKYLQLNLKRVIKARNAAKKLGSFNPNLPQTDFMLALDAEATELVSEHKRMYLAMRRWWAKAEYGIELEDKPFVHHPMREGRSYETSAALFSGDRAHDIVKQNVPRHLRGYGNLQKQAQEQGFRKYENGLPVNAYLQPIREARPSPYSGDQNPDTGWDEGEAAETWMIEKPVSPEAKAVEGMYSFSPKPAREFIIVAQKPPLEKTNIQQAMKYQNGGVYFERCRIPADYEQLLKNNAKGYCGNGGTGVLGWNNGDAKSCKDTAHPPLSAEEQQKILKKIYGGRLQNPITFGQVEQTGFKIRVPKHRGGPIQHDQTGEHANQGWNDPNSDYCGPNSF